MARVPYPTRDQVPPEGRAAFDEIEGSRGGVRGPFAAMMHAPELARRTANLGSFVRFESSLGHVERELAVLATSAAIDGEYEVVAHSKLGRHFGVRPEAIDIVCRNDGLDGLTENEAVVVRFARELIRTNRVSDATFAAARGLVGELGVVELAATVGYYTLLGYFMNALEVMPPDDPTWPPLPK
jgi:4-carboxymuconolactone decarboxylase